MAAATLYVCTTCRSAEHSGAAAFMSCADCPLLDGATRHDPACDQCRVTATGTIERTRPGALLLDAIQRHTLPENLRVQAVECLSACANGCSVALSSPGKWTYVYGLMDPARHVADILVGAARYAASADGIVPWRERPEIFRKQSLARIPPLEKTDD